VYSKMLRGSEQFSLEAVSPKRPIRRVSRLAWNAEWHAHHDSQCESWIAITRIGRATDSELRLPYRTTSSKQLVLMREPAASIGISHMHLYCGRRGLTCEQFFIFLTRTCSIIYFGVVSSKVIVRYQSHVGEQ